MYNHLKKLLFKLDPEFSHTLAMKSLQLAYALKLLHMQTPSHPVNVMGLAFPNKVGVAAGLDKDGDYIDALSALGFGFIEIGTVLPKPQPGNPKPRIFRLTAQEAVINRMGFPSKGLDYVIKNLERRKYRGILGINIGKNSTTPIENAVDDYVICFRALAKFASYVTINISSPNTQGLRALQHGDLLNNLLTTMKREQAAQQKYTQLVVKISPDLTADELRQTAEIILAHKIDGVIATNTSLTREGVTDSPYASEAGGLSGTPITKRSTAVIQQLHSIFKDQIPIIASGGVMDAQTAKEKFQAGAKLVQVYTGLIYSGIGLIKQIS